MVKTIREGSQQTRKKDDGYFVVRGAAFRHVESASVKEALIYSRGRAEVFALAGQGARSAVGLLPISDEQRRSGCAKARPRWGFAHKGTPAAFPGLTIEWLWRGAGRLASVPLWTETRSARIDQGFLELVSPLPAPEP